MRLNFRSIYMDLGNTIAFGVAIVYDNGEEKRHAVGFPTTITADQAAAKLRELVDWIVENAK